VSSSHNSAPSIRGNRNDGSSVGVSVAVLVGAFVRTRVEVLVGGMVSVAVEIIVVAVGSAIFAQDWIENIKKIITKQGINLSIFFLHLMINNCRFFYKDKL
jgi:hypothetical protein